MTNRDTFTPAPVGKFMFEELDQRWHHIKHGEAQLTEPRLPMVKLYGEETVRKLLEERDADKKLISEFQRQEHYRIRQAVIDGLAACGECWDDIKEYMEKWDAEAERIKLKAEE